MSSSSSDSDVSQDDNDRTGPLHNGSYYSSHDDDDDSSTSSTAGTDHKNEEKEDALPLAERVRRFDRQYGRAHQKKALVSTSKTLLPTGSVKRKQVDNDPSVTKKKKSKHAPTEASSRRRPSRATTLSIELPHRPTAVDPRAESSGTTTTANDQRYAFVQDLRRQELKNLKERRRARQAKGRRGNRWRRRLGLTNNTETEHDESRILQLKQEIAQYDKAQLQKEAARRVRQQFKQTAATEGSSKPRYRPKRQEERELLRKAEMDLLRQRKGAGAVEKVLAKRRKRTKARDAAHML